jgi:peptide-methionine (S)-S-oxide reductase
MKYLILLFTLNIIPGFPETQKPVDIMANQPQKEIATFGGGCFWCTEAVFESLKGVYSVESGYSGGSVKNPSYREVCSGSTGHAEVIQIYFDPLKISFRDLLEVFFETHDPTSLNRQGADTGTQYRSVIFYHNSRQKEIAEEFIRDLNSKKVYQNPVVTEVAMFTAFYLAEDYHQDYFRKNPDLPYCSYVINPKLLKFRNNYADMLK